MKLALKEWAKCPKAVRLTIVSVMCSIIATYINAQIILELTKAIDNWQNINQYILPIMIMIITSSLLNTADRVIGRVAGHHSFTQLNNKFAERVQYMKYKAFEKYSPDYMQTMLERLGYISDAVDYVIITIESIISVIILLLAIYRIDPISAIPILFIYIIGFIISNKCYSIYIKAKKIVLDLKRDRNKELSETISAFQEIRTHNTQRQHILSIRNKNEKVMHTQLEVDKGISLTVMSLNMIDVAVMAVVLLCTPTSIAIRGISPSSMLAIVMYTWQLFVPVNSIMNIIPKMSEVGSSMPELIEILHINEEEDGNIRLTEFNNSIEFRNVSFSYEESDSVLTNINLTILKGEKIGICGPSGEGKSTLLKLLTGFYRDYTGSILIDGIELRDLKIETFRSKLGVVHQDNYIFNESAFDNIKYASPDSLDSDVIEASKKAAIYDFIQNLPEKFNTNVGPKGMKLSGGQKQRIALARIFLKNPNIVLLDEATSALDNESENIIQDAIDNLNDNTVITVAHRLSTIMNCDRIVVIDNHQITAIGNHQSLMEYDNVYSRLWKASKKA